MPKEHTKPESKFKPDREVLNSAYKRVFGLTAFFFVTAMLGAVIGGWIDNQFGVKPWGTLGTLLAFYVVSGSIGFIITKRFTNNVDDTK